MALWCNKCRRAEPIIINYSQFVPLYSRINYPRRKAHAPYYIAVYGLSGPTIFFHYYLTNGTIFERKKERKKELNINCVF